jgi:hypothetical protein
MVANSTEELGEALIGLHFWTVPLPDGVRPIQNPACQHRAHQSHLVLLGGRPGMTGKVEVTLQEKPPTMSWGAVKPLREGQVDIADWTR